MSKTIVLAGFFFLAGGALAQAASATDRALGPELNRERAETRIERLRQDQRQKEEQSEPRAQKRPAGNPKQQPPR